MSAKAGTGERTQCVARNKAVARAADIAKAAQVRLRGEGRPECSSHDLAARWGYASHHVVADLFDSTSGAAMLLGDPLAMPRELGIAIYRGLLGALDAEGASGQTERETVDRLGHALNAAVRGLLDDLGDNGRRESDAATWKTQPRGTRGLVDIVDGAGNAVAQCVHPAHAPLLLAAAAEAVALRARVAALEATLAARDARQLTLDVEGR